MSTDRDVPLIWYVFSMIWYEYGSVIIVPGTCITSTFNQMVLVCVVILDQVKNIIRPSPHEFQNWVHTISCLSVTF